MEEIIQLEWELFQQVQNEGGRASCQDEYRTFHIMREAQFSQWPAELQASYLADLKAAIAEGRNLVMEKYAWMMEHTAPNQFESLRPFLTLPEAQVRRQIEEIVQIQVAWMREFVVRYPKIAGRGRPVSTQSDREYTTSGETYLRGELYTYSPKTLRDYQAYVNQLCAEGRNLHLMITERMVQLKGYASLDDAEKRI